LGASVALKSRIGQVVGALVAALLGVAASAHGQLRSALADAARAFDESALRSEDNNAKPMPVRKWTDAVRLAFANPAAAPALVEVARQGIKTIATEAGISVIDVPDKDPSANFVVVFDENGLNGKSGYCFGSAWWNKSRVIYRGELRLNPMRIKDFDRCAIHEPLHSFGFLSHPHAADSVLSYVTHAQRTLTALDRDLIHTLYDSRLTPGMPPAPASRQACRILGERLRASAADIAATCNDRKGPTSAN
jgi:hypothetical protein